ncbi:MAG: dihydroorotate dehydrogenase electron transfer subunit, partial [Candidatus Omnitrophica bacterium]|nr:dihydroorotate dehydrogenase electron transfer subunit [Candidatus Omnitrophota bacterium]
MPQIKAKVIKNIVVAPECYKMLLACAPIAKSARPGEFVTIKISAGDQPLLRRPFGVHRVGANRFEILYEVVGPGTRILSKKKAGEYIDIIGPLGQGFDYHRPSTIDHRPILVAGGMGVAPLLFLAEKLVTKSPSHQ